MKLRWIDHLRRRSLSPLWMSHALVLVSTGLMIVGGWAAVHDQVRREQRLAEEAAIRQTDSRAIAFEQYVGRTFEGADLVTRYLGDKYLRDRPAAPRAGPLVPLLIRDQIVSGTYGVATVVSARGDLLATTDRRAAQPANVARNPVFISQSAHPGPELLISPPVRSRVLGETFIYLTRRVLDDDGATLGFVGVQIRPADLSNFIRSARFESTDLISVIGLDGITRARREGNRLSFGEDVRDSLVMRMQERHPNGSYVGPSAIDGHVRYFSHRRMANYPIFVTAGTSQAAALEPVSRRTEAYVWIMTLVTLVSLVIAAAILIGVRRRHNRGRELASANARLREAQRIAKVGDWEYDLRSGAIFWSDQLCEMYERDSASDQLHLHEFYNYLDDDGRSTVARLIASALSTGKSQTCEFKAYLPSGAISDRFVNAIPVRSDAGAVTSLVGTDQDVTADKLVEGLQEQINHLSRLDAMNMMASTLAHELNQPLTAASSYLSGGERLLAREYAAARPMIVEAISAARSQVQTAGSIIRRVRDMMRSDRRIAEPIEVKPLLQDTIALLAKTNSCSRKWVRFDVHDDAQVIWGDRVQIQQVLMNLIRNGCEAAVMNDKPAVRVSVSPQQDGFVQIDVSDNGEGISGAPDQLFSPFHSTKGRGRGLGLSISRTIVEYHGGQIRVESTGRGGTVISFTVRGEPEDRSVLAKAS